MSFHGLMAHLFLVRNNISLSGCILLFTFVYSSNFHGTFCSCALFSRKMAGLIHVIHQIKCSNFWSGIYFTWYWWCFTCEEINEITISWFVFIFLSLSPSKWNLNRECSEGSEMGFPNSVTRLCFLLLSNDLSVCW